MTTNMKEPGELDLDELRAERARLQAEEHAVSFARRLAQGRLDLVRAEIRLRSEGRHLDLETDLTEALGQHVVARGDGDQSGVGSARPPRTATVPDDHPLLHDLDARCESLRLHDLLELDSEGIEALVSELDTFEHACSAERHALFQRIDALTAELVRRYRDGAASVDHLLSGPADA